VRSHRPRCVACEPIAFAAVAACARSTGTCTPPHPGVLAFSSWAQAVRLEELLRRSLPAAARTTPDSPGSLPVTP
jgi:hypothetical protein